MSSRLASLLVHEGHVSPARMAEVFQRQVIYGGALDTALLEMGLVGGRVLLEALGRVTGLPVLAEVPPGDLAALARELPEAEAERFQMVPVRVREGRLEVAMTEPANPEQLQKLSPLLGRRVDVWIVPEYMLQFLRERVYGTPLSARFAALWAKAGPRAQAAAAGRQRTQKRPPERSQEQPQRRGRQDAIPRSLPDAVTVREGAPRGPQVATSVEAQVAEKVAAPPAAPAGPPSDVTLAVVEGKRPEEVGTTPVRGEGLVQGEGQHQVQSHETVRVEGGQVVEKHFPMSPLLGEVTEPILDAKTRVWVRPPAPSTPVTQEEPEALADEEGEPDISIEDEMIGGGPDFLTDDHGAPEGSGGQGLPQDGGRDTGGLLGAEEMLDAEAEEALLEGEGEGEEDSEDEEYGVEVVTEEVGETLIESEEIHSPGGDVSAEVAAVPEAATGTVNAEVDDEATRRENFLRALQPHVDAAARAAPARGEERSSLPGVRQADSVPSIEVPTREPMPLEIERALTALDEAAERDAVFETLCQLVRNYFEVAVLFAVQAERATARAGLGRQWLSREALAELKLSLNEPSAFKTTVEGRSPYLGQLGNDRPMAGLLSALSRPVPVRGALFPLVLRSRVVAVLFGVAGSQEFGELPLADLTRVMAEAAQALQRIILVSKSGAHAINLGAAGSGDARGRSTNGPQAGVPEESTRPDDTERLTLLEGPLGENLMQLVDIVAADREGALAAGEALVAAGEPGAMALAARLPGPLRLRRHSFATPLSPLSAYGPLLGLVARFGRAIVLYLIARLDEAATEVRFYTALAFSELPLPEVVSPLGERLFDADLGVRRAAATALGRFPPSPEMQALMESLRRTLAAPDIARQRMAVEALGELRDAASLPRLMELLSKRDELMVIAVRRALITIAKQDFGTSRWRWRGWWEENRHRSRIEWLLEGLNHSDATVRQSASDELGVITSEAFGYHVALPRPAREEARQRWLKWYKQQAAVDTDGEQGQNP